ncbi:hypothetical protein GCM10022276_07600 [Sphingomonas limnosediminicola]|jgi:hypothetical protein|uniref:DUF3617 family protein n=1 Tax=Sphingomonas limnosediminicola TaxID=940133 RepID=A0ABP7KZP5_9SPHN
MAIAKLLGVAGAAIAGTLALTAAQRPSALFQAAPGLWEVSGVPGARGPLKQCLTDIAPLARFEHRNRSCSARVISDNASSTVVEYSCGAAGFGRSRIESITPRSLRIETQGIAQSLPFNYVIQARRVGDCSATASRH